MKGRPDLPRQTTAIPGQPRLSQAHPDFEQCYRLMGNTLQHQLTAYHTYVAQLLRHGRIVFMWTLAMRHHFCDQKTGAQRFQNPRQLATQKTAPGALAPNCRKKASESRTTAINSIHRDLPWLCRQKIPCRPPHARSSCRSRSYTAVKGEVPEPVISSIYVFGPSAWPRTIGWPL